LREIQREIEREKYQECSAGIIFNDQERERDTHRAIMIKRERETHTERHRDTERYRQTDRQIDRQTR